MSRPEFLTTPGVWMRAGSRMADPVRDACAVEHHARRSEWRATLVMVALAVVVAIGVALGSL